MSNILDRLAEHARERVAAAKQRIPEAEIRREAERKFNIEAQLRACGGSADVHSPGSENGRVTANQSENQRIAVRPFAFEKALKKEALLPDGTAAREMAFICECKKASPSKGLIAPEFPYLEIAKAYEAAGADCISVLTEPKWFLGSDRYLEEITATVSIPCIRKDFTIDPYMIYEAKVLGASAVLLICAILDDGQLRAYREICDSLGLSALVEAHDEAEIERALRASARIIGVNNRNLKDFSVDTGNSGRLRSLVPKDVVFVSESGIREPADITGLRAIGVDAVLIGEKLMRAADKGALLSAFRKAGRTARSGA